MTAPIATFRLTRTIATPQDRLWHLLTDSKSRELWGAPSDDAVLVLETTDLREGGQERHRCGPADNPEFTVDTHWYHIDAPTRACFTETVIAGGQRFGVSLVTYVLAPDDPATTLTVDVAVASMTGEDMQGDFDAGWTSGLDRLERLIRSGELK
ncbi:MAG: SRPBCC domain-containing protein [Marivita sp.]|uniref:SRPBCC domain-containing protein n=1 Tax=Marivita sp. TaxID=2003365 RepID=UPI0025BFBF07|nr:SRPBCC domain-containing protein [Marivita sp.]MCI5112248.1 SRPBCC domain-containing protein [Marivita sp.]